MNIGIIGSGNVGSTLGEIWAKAGHQVMFSFSRHPECLQTLATQIGSNAMSGTPAEAVNFADVVLFAPNFWLVQEAIAQAGSLAGKIVIDATNPYRWGKQLMDDIRQFIQCQEIWEFTQHVLAKRSAGTKKLSFSIYF
jgi:8-hydroxy-5-deazaflavin:NADPH oxidoreductase